MGGIRSLDGPDVGDQGVMLNGKVFYIGSDVSHRRLAMADPVHGTIQGTVYFDYLKKKEPSTDSGIPGRPARRR